MTKPIHARVANRLETYRRDYEQVEGKPFRHFFCPILGIDEPIISPNRLIRGHIINQSFEDAPRAWVVQRSDVDNFYGSKFEAEFETLQHRAKLTPLDALTKRSLAKKFNPTISLNGREVCFISQPSSLPNGFTRVEFGAEPGGPSIGIKMGHDDLIEAEATGGRWEFAMLKDARIPALVSVLKAAHLTTFHLLGYRYATSPAGLLIGHDLLGRFFRANVNLSRKEVVANAWSFFREFTHAFRPILNLEVGYQGTISDRRVLACYSTSGRIWAQIVLVKAANQMHAVMLPIFDFIDSVATYLDFLKNDNERIEVATAEFDRKNLRWTLYGDRRTQHWPKQGLLYPRIPDPVDFPFMEGRVTIPNDGEARSSTR